MALAASLWSSFFDGVLTASTVVVSVLTIGIADAENDPLRMTFGLSANCARDSTADDMPASALSWREIVDLPLFREERDEGSEDESTGVLIDFSCSPVDGVEAPVSVSNSVLSSSPNEVALASGP